jgi:hypothetical protein
VAVGGLELAHALRETPAPAAVGVHDVDDGLGRQIEFVHKGSPWRQQRCCQWMNLIYSPLEDKLHFLVVTVN